MNCPNCNMPVQSGDRFCENCGTPLSGMAQKPMPEANAASSAPCFCENCGNRLNPGDRFCESCGTPVPQGQEAAPVVEPVAEAVSEGTTCPKCGNMVNEGDLFCENCGNKLGELPTTVAQSAPQPEPEPRVERAYTPQPLWEPAAQSVSQPAVETVVEPQPMVTLVGENRSYHITSFPSVVGKGSAADTLVSGDESVSRTHMRIGRSADGFTVEDLNSTNRTYLNGSFIEPHVPVALKNGDTLKMGDTKLKVEIR